MGKVNKNDHKAAKNRARVRKHRHWKKNKVIHEKYIHDEIFTEENVCSDSILKEIFENNSQQRDSKIDKATEISDKLKYWCVHHRITSMAINDLLHILRFAGLSMLPKDSRTLMETPVHVPIQTLTNGKLWYNGIKTSLLSALGKILHDISITLDWNFDGFPVAKSSNIQFWPILASIRGMYMFSDNVF